MRKAILMAGLLALASAAPAAAEPVAFGHGTVDSTLTATQPDTPTGFHYVGDYHAAGDPSGDPPYMRKMITYNPSGLRFDTTVPEQCTASDLELALRGPDACPAGSRLGGGTAYGKFMGEPTELPADFFNADRQQIILARSPFVTTVIRGTIHDDGSIEFAAPTCYPALNPPGCPVDSALQTGSDIAVGPFVRDGRSYQTTPPTCPASGAWKQRIKFWWADGSVDTVVTRLRCQPA